MELSFVLKLAKENLIPTPPVLGEVQYQRRSSALKLLRSWCLLYLSKPHTLHTDEVISLSQSIVGADFVSVISRPGGWWL